MDLYDTINSFRGNIVLIKFQAKKEKEYILLNTSLLVEPADDCMELEKKVKYYVKNNYT